MRNIENDHRYRRRNSVRPSKTTREGPLTKKYRVILTFFVIGCLTTFLISGVRNVYGAGISIPVRVDYGSVPVGETAVRTITITNTAKTSFTIIGVPKWAPPDYHWWTLVPPPPVNCEGATLNPKQSCTLTYSFSPPAVSSYDYTLNISYTYDGKTVNNANTHFYGTGTKGTATVTLSNLTQTYTGSPLMPTATTTPAGLLIVWTGAPQTNAGSYSVVATVNDANYQGSASGTFTINRATPSVTTWPTASGVIAYGQPISASTLTLSGGSASVEGSFSFTNPSETPNVVGPYIASVTFTPNDPINYNTVIGGVTLDVAKATPTVIWPTASGITYGDALSASTLTDGSASVPGTFAFTNPSTVPDACVPPDCTYSASVTFMPDDLVHYNTVTGSVSVVVAQATPTIAWDNPADITHPTPLTAIQLNATASFGGQSVDGTFTYNPVSCTVLDEGNGQILSVTFTPSSLNYGTATATVTINVLAPYVTKDQIFDSWVCTQRVAASGLPIAMYLCTGSDGSALDCSSCITAENRCADLSLAEVYFSMGALQWAGPGSSKNIDFITSTTIYSCTDRKDLCFACGVPWSSTCDGSAPNSLDIPTVTTTTLEKIGNVWVCSGTEAESGCVTDIYSCPNATDTNPCYCPDNPVPWQSLTPSQVSFAAGELEWAGTGSGNANCQIVYFVTKKTINNVPTSCIYKCISDTGAETETCYSNCPPTP